MLHNARVIAGTAALVVICVAVSGQAATQGDRIAARPAVADVTGVSGIAVPTAPPAKSPGQTAAGSLGKVHGMLLRAREQVHSIRSRAFQPRELAALSVDRVLRVSPHGDMHCYVYVDADGITDANIQRLTEAGLRPELAAKEMNVVQGWLPTERLEQVAALPFVRRITPPDYAVTRCVGSVCTEGDAILNADDLRALGYDGTGVKVGVISNGVDSRASAVASGDLPASITIHPTLGGSGDEGTAMLEIVHDLAPGASLFFAGPSTSVEMVSAINWLANTAACDVIVDDLGFYGQPFFADGSVALAARNAVTVSNRVYASAAGNDCGFHYQGFYTYYAPYYLWDLHDFKAGTGVDDNLDIWVHPGELLVVFLQWDEPFGASGEDYDLLLFDFTDGMLLSGALVGGQTTQDGNDDPEEFVVWVNNDTVDHDIGVAVGNYYGLAAPQTLEIFAWLPFSDDDDTCGDSIFGHPAVAEVISCGAIDSFDAGNDDIEWFSSWGPSTIAFPSTQIRPTPFCASIDGVSVTGAGGFPSTFFGTSAAGPHAAAVAALLLDVVDLAATPQDIADALAGGAVDLPPTGFDDVFGHGRLDALAAKTVLCQDVGPTLVSSEPPADGTLPKTQNNFISLTFDRAIMLPVGVNPLTITEIGGADVTDRFAYQLDTNDPSGATLKAIENGVQLANQTWYRVTPGADLCAQFFVLDVCTLRGDCNNSGRLTVADYSCVKAEIGERSGVRADLNGSDRVTVADYSVVKAYLGDRQPEKP